MISFLENFEKFSSFQTFFFKLFLFIKKKTGLKRVLSYTQLVKRSAFISFILRKASVCRTQEGMYHCLCKHQTNIVIALKTVGTRESLTSRRRSFALHFMFQELSHTYFHYFHSLCDFGVISFSFCGCSYFSILLHLSHIAKNFIFVTVKKKIYLSTNYY